MLNKYGMERRVGGEEEGKEVERVGDERKEKEKAKVETVICVTYMCY